MIQLQRKVKLEKFFGGVNRKENEPQNPEPVSYTHLDVYKRQL